MRLVFTKTNGSVSINDIEVKHMPSAAELVNEGWSASAQIEIERKKIK